MVKMKFVDSNIFLELILNDEKANDCELFFNKLINKEINAVTSDFIVYSCLLKIEQKLKSITYMKQFLAYINGTNIQIIRPSIKEILDAIKISDKYHLDFDDGLVVSLMTNNNIKELISFDKHFDKISLIKREAP